MESEVGRAYKGVRRQCLYTKYTLADAWGYLQFLLLKDRQRPNLAEPKITSADLARGFHLLLRHSFLRPVTGQEIRGKSLWLHPVNPRTGPSWCLLNPSWDQLTPCWDSNWSHPSLTFSLDGRVTRLPILVGKVTFRGSYLPSCHCLNKAKCPVLQNGVER